MKNLLVIILTFTIGLTYGQTDTTVVDSLATINLQGIEVTGVRADSKTPVTETTVTKEEIKEAYQGEEVSIVLDKTPSITSSTDGGHPQGYTYFRLRGIDQTRINMTLNGVPLNEPEDQGVYFSNYPGFSNNIQSMQIQRGVGTSSNGVSSYGGSINFESPNGLDKGVDVEMGWGSFNATRINVGGGTGLTKKGFAFYGNASTFGTDGYKDNSGSVGYSAFVSGGYYGSKDVIKVTAFTGRSWNKMAWAAVSEDDIKIDPRTNYNTINEDDDFMQSFAQLQYTRKVGENSTLNTTAYYNRLDGDWDLDLEPFGAGKTVLNYQLASNFYGLMSNYKYTTKNLNFNVGVHGNMYDRTHEMAILPDVETTFYTNTGFKNEVSAFAKAGYDIGKFTLFGDAQLRHVTFRYEGDTTMPDLNWTFFNPKGGIVYNHSDKVRAYASVGQSHREPTRNDMFGGEDNLIGYTEVKPEEVIDYELGASYKTNKFLFAPNVYYMTFKNEITLIGALGSNGLPLMTNVESSFRSGVEMLISYNMNKNLSISNNTNLSYNRITDGGTEYQPLYTPPVVSNTFVRYKYKSISVGVNGKYHSESYIDVDNNHVTPAFFVLGADVAYTVKALTISGKVNNLTNQQYYTNGYAIGDTRYFYVNAPLSGYVTVKLSF
jgi:iron complex outermembrane receptor protein